MEDPNALVVPLDIILPIVELLTDRRDLNRCALVSRAFNGAATPHLYRTLDSRIRSTVSTCQVFVEVVIELRERERRGQRDAIRERIAHPSKTILQKPWYAKYVRHVSETGAFILWNQTQAPDFTLCRPNHVDVRGVQLL